MINSPQLSMSLATMEREIVDINVRLNQVMRQQFSRHNFHLGNYFKNGLSFVGLTWLVVGNNEDLVSSKKQVEPRDLLDKFPFHPLPVYFAEHIQLKCISWFMHYIFLRLMLLLCTFRTITINKCTYEPTCQQLNCNCSCVIERCVPQHQIKTDYATVTAYST